MCYCCVCHGDGGVLVLQYTVWWGMKTLEKSPFILYLYM